MAHTITRWDPFTELADMRSRFDRLFGDLANGDREWMPAVDMIRENGHLIVRAEVPGFKPEEIDIQAEGGRLTISGKHEESSEEKGKEFVRRERRYGAFSRTMTLPDGVDPKKIKATTADGVLEITVPLPKEATAEPVSITPTAGG
jgi:HSP20 family protein